MSNIKNRPAEVEQEQHAQANNSDAPTSGFHDETLCESSGDEDKIREPVTLFFSRELAKFLNSAKPDITGALILFGLYLWQRKPVSSFRYRPMVNGERGCYQSLSELQASYPWLTEEAIRKALKRAEVTLKGDFIIERANENAVRGKLHFWISPLLIKTYRFDAPKKRGLLALDVHDAVNCGVLEAILIQNLKHITEEAHNSEPLRDEAGNIYRELSATKLTKPTKNMHHKVPQILPCSRKAVSAALGTLRAAGVLVEHPRRKHFYRLKCANDSVTKVASDVTKVARRVTKVARRNVALPCNMYKNSDLQRIAKTSYTNTDANPDTKCIFPSPASLRSPEHGWAGGLSAGGKKLTMLISEHLEASRQSRADPPPGVTMDSYKVFNVTDHDKHEFAGFDLPYDFIGLEWYSGKPYSRQAEIEHFMEEMILEFQVNDFAFTKQDISKLRELFTSHPGLTPGHLLPLLHRKPWDIVGQPIPIPKKGHDQWYWSRRITNLKQFLRYLPQLAREYHVSEQFGICGNETTFDREVNGRPIFHYDEMPQPLLEVAFENETKLPVTREYIEDEDGEFGYRSIYYPEFAGLPTVDHVNIDHNPVLEHSLLRAAWRAA